MDRHRLDTVSREEQRAADADIIALAVQSLRAMH